MRNFIKKIIHPFLRVGSNIYFSKPRAYCYDGICVDVLPDVFPPHLTISTKILLDYLKDIDIKGKNVLELGCGSGIISLYCASKGAQVIATDINTIALEALQLASEKNKLPIEVQYSNLFDNIPETHFNYIIINPPYYPKEPKSIKEKAWFCGENFEYFENLFQQLRAFANNSIILMILSEDCDIEYIQSISLKSNLVMSCILEKKVVGEKNFIFKINYNEKMD